jgi:hypothetical protein
MAIPIVFFRKISEASTRPTASKPIRLRSDAVRLQAHRVRAVAQTLRSRADEAGQIRVSIQFDGVVSQTQVPDGGRRVSSARARRQ